MTAKLRFSALPLAAAVAPTILAGSAPLAAAPNAHTPQYLADFPHFNPSLSTTLPGDVDVALKKKLEAEKRFADVQRVFDLWSWQAFLSLNWPTNDKGQFAP